MTLNFRSTNKRMNRMLISESVQWKEETLCEKSFVEVQKLFLYFMLNDLFYLFSFPYKT